MCSGVTSQNITAALSFALHSQRGTQDPYAFYSEHNFPRVAATLRKFARYLIAEPNCT
jgi:hypothetical protein